MKVEGDRYTYFMKKSAKILGVVCFALFIVLAATGYVVLREDRHGVLSVAFLDVGQGDAIFIDSPSGAQVLIDGGPDSSILRRLSSVIPLWDRSIDVVIATHPDSDHIAGLIEILKRYDVSYVLQSDVHGSTPTYDALEEAISMDEKRGTKEMTARRGQMIDLGDGAYVEILSPDRVAHGVDTNVGCVVAKLIYGKTSFLFSCDAPQSVEEYLVALDGSGLHADVLKAGHHGSKTSSAPIFVGSVDPVYVVFSRGCDNSYGFPHKETIETYQRFGIQMADTCKEGTVIFTSDGTIVRRG